jgi:hypothetical protein
MQINPNGKAPDLTCLRYMHGIFSFWSPSVGLGCEVRFGSYDALTYRLTREHDHQNFTSTTASNHPMEPPIPFSFSGLGSLVTDK